MTTRHDLHTVTDRPGWLPHQAWPFEVRLVTIDGRAVAYTDEGQGPILLLVHDGMWSYVWGQLIETMRDRFRLITLDFPGSGLSPDDNADVSLRSDSMLLERFVDALRLTDMTLVVHDLGGSVGVGLAGRRPELIGGIVFMNTFAWPPDVVPLRIMFRLMTSRPIRAVNVGTNLIPRLSSGVSGVGRHFNDDQRQAFLGGFKRRSSRHRFHDTIASARRDLDFLTETEQVLAAGMADIPALSIYGARNDPFGFQARFRQFLPHIEEMVIEGGNHFPMADDPDGVAHRIADWHRRLVAER